VPELPDILLYIHALEPGSSGAASTIELGSPFYCARWNRGWIAQPADD
jgi:hypothetical protein